MTTLFSEMEGFKTYSKNPIILIAATNYGIKKNESEIGTLDKALVSRFDVKKRVYLPEEKDRKDFLKHRLANYDNIVTDKQINSIAERSIGMSPRDLSRFLEYTEKLAIRNNTIIDDKILDEAFETHVHGDKKDWGEEYLTRVARHEAGHAIMAIDSRNIPSYLSVVARGSHGGYMQHSDTEDKPSMTKDELLARIRVSLGGRAAEIVYYGDDNGIDTGASSDLDNATHYAKIMLTAYGMYQDYGLATFNEKEAEIIDERTRNKINEILTEQLKITIDTIESKKSDIDKLVKTLVKRRNSLNKEDITKLLGL